jgi:hypothetical protein
MRRSLPNPLMGDEVYWLGNSSKPAKPPNATAHGVLRESSGKVHGTLPYFERVIERGQ